MPWGLRVPHMMSIKRMEAAFEFSGSRGDGVVKVGLTS